MHLMLGSHWRNYYIETLGFLNETLDTSEIYVRSTGTFPAKNSR
jgi:hypothetical protein